MLQQEFESRVKMSVTQEEYASIEQVYMNSDLEKDEFCKVWVKMNKTRVQRTRVERKFEQEQQRLRDALWHIVEKIQWLDYDQQIKIARDYLTDRDEKALEEAGISLETPNGVVNRFKYGYEIVRDVKNYLGI